MNKIKSFFERTWDWRLISVTTFAFIFGFVIWRSQIGDLDGVFLDLDKSLQHGNVVIDKSNKDVFHAIDSTADAYKNPTTLYYLNCAERADSLADSLYFFIENYRKDLIMLSGGLDENGHLKNYKDCDIAYSYFRNSEKIQQLSDFTNNVGEQFLNIFKDKKDSLDISKLLTITKDTQLIQQPFFKHNFKNTSLAKTLAILSQLQNDVWTSKFAILNQIFRRVGGSCMGSLDRFIVGVSPNSLVGIQNEKFTADIILCAYSSNPGNIRFKINGKESLMKEGIAHLESRPRGLGTHKILVEADLYQNRLRKPPLLYQTIRKTFIYEVVAPFLDIETPTSRILYQNIEKGFSVNMAKEELSNIKLSSKNLIINQLENGKFTLKATKTGKAYLKISGNHFSQIFDFKVKSLPTPLIKLGGKLLEGTLTPNEFLQYQNLQATVPDFDEAIDYEISSFVFHYLPKNEDEIELLQQGSAFSAEAKALQQKAKSGDIFYLTDIVAKYNGQEINGLNTLVFVIK